MSTTFSAESIRFVSARGLQFRVFDQGQGAPVLLLHGFPDSLDLWAATAQPLLAAGYRVIAYDQRGYGESDAPRSTAAYDIEEIAADAPAILDALGITQPVYLMGHDWGAVVAWAVTLFYPERVRALVAVSVGHPQSYSRGGLEQKLSKGLYIVLFQLRGLTEWYLLRAGGMRKWLGSGKHIDNVMRRMSRPGRLTAALNWYRANFKRGLFGKWGQAERPTLGVWSSDDAYLTETQMVNSQRYVNSTWQYQRIDQCGHWIPLEQPDRLANLALDWFSQHQDTNSNAKAAVSHA
ncbi:MAG: alpha/beta fold hydrolase [Pseudomonadaceae bacterium]